MKSFFKYLLATVVGMLIVCIVMFFFMIGTLGAMMVGQSKAEVQVKDNTVLKISLNKEISDKSHTASRGGMAGFALPDFSKTLGLNEMLKAIDYAKEDARIKGIYLTYEGGAAGFATTQELRKALASFKESGKFIYAYADFYPQNAYHLASIADSIFIQPQSSLVFQGMAAQVMFYTKFLEKIGVQMQVIRHGQFKSAVEPFMRTDMSPANRLQYKVLFNSMWEVISKDVAASRNLSLERVNEIADSLLGFTAAGAVKAGLADAMVPGSYVEEKALPVRMGLSDSVKVNMVSLSDYVKTIPGTKASSKNKIAVIYAEGDIVGGKGSAGHIGTELTEQIEKVLKDKNVKALVLRVNSPGGSVLTSDIIYQEMLKVKEKMPVVASYGNYAASGGYYISCMAHKIYASPNTLTGSIGVFGTIPNVKGLVTDKLGLTIDYVQTNKNATSFSGFFRPLTSYEESVMQQNIEEIYAGFIGKVAEGRHMTPAQVDSIGQGRVWSGTNAIGIGLVDELGGLQDAIAGAAELAGISDYTLVEYPKEKTFSEQLLELLDDASAKSAQAYIARQFGTAGVEIYSQFSQFLQSDKPQVWARMPEILVFE